jgi:hypothetical protein
MKRLQTKKMVEEKKIEKKATLKFKSAKNSAK